MKGEIMDEENGLGGQDNSAAQAAGVDDNAGAEDQNTQDKDHGDAGQDQADDDAKGADGEDPKGQEKMVPEWVLHKKIGRQQRKFDHMLKEQEERFNVRLAALEQNTAKFTNPKPEPANYATQEEYINAVVDWKIRDGGKDSGASRNPATAGREATGSSDPDRMAEFKTGIDNMLEDGRDKYDDWDDIVTTDAAKLPISTAMAKALVDSEVGVDLTYYLGKNPNEAKRISKLPPARQYREIVKLEALFGASQPGGAKQITTIKPVGANSKGTSMAKDPSKMGYDEYKAWRASGGGN